MRYAEQPERVVVETGSYSVVASLRERLILVVAAAVRELRRCDVKYALTCAFRYLVHKTDEILVGIPESHTSAYSALEITGAAAHVEGDHTLVLVPYIHHAVQLFNSCRGLELAKKPVPVGSEIEESPVHFLYAGIAGDYFPGDALVEQPFRGKLLFLRILGVTQNEDYVSRSSG